MSEQMNEGNGTAGRDEREVRPLVEPTATVTPLSASVRLDWYSVGAAHNAKPSLLYALTSEDVAAVNAARKARAEKTLRRLDLCECDHNQYCRHCHPVEFRLGGVWHGG
jgi:hypothetical protein